MILIYHSCANKDGVNYKGGREERSGSKIVT